MSNGDSSEVLRRLARQSVDGWTESDVREDFIAPLLRLLGYEKGTDYDINRETQHLLSKPFLMIGSKKQKLDYALMVRKRTFWLLEAKRPEPRRVSEEAIFQAHFYALHPEVASRYFGVCNGRELVLYDVRNIDDAYTPIFRCDASELPSRFQELSDLIGAGSLVRHLKRRVLEDTRSLLSSEVREEQVQEFASQFQVMLREVEPQVRENRLAVWQRKHQEYRRTFEELADDASLLQIPRVLLEFAKNREELRIAHTSFKTKLDILEPEAKAKCLREMASLLCATPGTQHRYNILALLLRFEHEPSVAQLVREFVRDAILGFESRPLVRAQWKLEATLHRSIYKASFASPALLDEFRSAVAQKHRTLRDEEIVWLRPSVWSERHSWVRQRIDELWGRYCRAPLATIEAITQDLEQLESQVEAKCGDEIRERTASEGDLTWYADYDRPFDYMRSYLCGVLEPERTVANLLLEDVDLDNLAALLRQVSEGYAVNHADTLWMRINAMRGRISIPSELPPSVQECLSPEEVSAFVVSAHAHRRGRSALSDGVRVHGRAPRNGFVELSVNLDVDNRVVIVEGGKQLK